ncbi:MAG: transposase, partial [Candidatus Auribacterota bacterium]|nr:transposase [Candidatus Auribacterota bacterium]
KTFRSARKKYLDFVEKGIPDGKRSDLTGGGLVRSLGGWQAVLRMRKGRERFRGDERILGNSDFVLSALRVVEEKLVKREQKRSVGWSMEKLLARVAKQYEIDMDRILRGEKNRSSTRARALFCWWATGELGYTLTEAGDFLNISQQAVSQARKRGEILSERDNFQL